MKTISRQPCTAGQFYFVFEDMVVLQTRVSRIIIPLDPYDGKNISEEENKSLHSHGKQEDVGVDK